MIAVSVWMGYEWHHSWSDSAGDTALWVMVGVISMLAGGYLNRTLSPESWYFRVRLLAGRLPRWSVAVAGFITAGCVSLLMDMPQTRSATASVCAGWMIALAFGSDDFQYVHNVHAGDPGRAQHAAVDGLYRGTVAESGPPASPSVSIPMPRASRPALRPPQVLGAALITGGFLFAGAGLLLRGADSTNNGNRLVIIAIAFVAVMYTALFLRLRPSFRSIGTGMLWGLVATVVAGFLALAWPGHHDPSTFYYDAHAKVSVNHWPAGHTRYVGVTFSDPRHSGSVFIRSAAPHDLRDSTDANLTYFLCTPPVSTTIGSTYNFNPSQVSCSALPSAGSTMALKSQQLVVAITPNHGGHLEFHGIDLDYIDGPGSGIQQVGVSVNMRVIDPGSGQRTHP